ncbi:MAG: hypothetical protein Q9161_003913 [Pseudevernia consocians]
MAAVFLARLPKVGRGILAQEDQRCSICMEVYGTTPSASGIIERAVRLPCNHVIGSECISLWLTPSPSQRSSNNTCPVCRYVLFEASSQETETDDDDDDDDDAWHWQIHVTLRERIHVLGHHLSLSTNVTNMAGHIADRIHDRGPMNGRPLVAIAAGSLYMASYAMYEPRSLQAISRGTVATGMEDIGADVIQRTYDWLHQYRRRLIHEGLLERVTGRTLDIIDIDLP